MPPARFAKLAPQKSGHRIGLEYLLADTRRLHHSRDIGEIFDLLSWFEFASEHKAAFEELVTRLRATEAWTCVEREPGLTRLFPVVPIRLPRQRANRRKKLSAFHSGRFFPFAVFLTSAARYSVKRAAASLFTGCCKSSLTAW